AERAVKWARRRPVVAGLLAALVLAAVGLVGTTVWAVDGMWKAEQARNRARDAEAKARDTLAKGLTAVNNLSARLHNGKDWLSDEPRMERVRLQMAEDALKFYLEYRQGPMGNTPEVRTQVGLAYHLVGNIRKQLGKRAEAEEAFGQAILIFEGLKNESDE